MGDILSGEISDLGMLVLIVGAVVIAAILAFLGGIIAIGIPVSEYSKGVYNCLLIGGVVVALIFRDVSKVSK